MSITANQSATVPPRGLIRAFWAIHKTLVRLSGGRIGLWRPRKGKRFGVMALKTVGRRSGNERSVIVGYFEDGPNLVTLAMNGWADAEPAWWLNLQAQPDATVLLPTGARFVRARTARGEERDRLWAAFGDYPGWGENVEALARRRSRNTAVVVLEPRPPVEVPQLDRSRDG
jgi:F420H(2)-dependent quinone reductase